LPPLEQDGRRAISMPHGLVSILESALPSGSGSAFGTQTADPGSGRRPHCCWSRMTISGFYPRLMCRAAPDNNTQVALPATKRGLSAAPGRGVLQVWRPAAQCRTGCSARLFRE